MPSWDEIVGVVGLALSGNKTEGKTALLSAWSETGEGDHAQRCVLAHYLADLEDNLHDELRWDEVALVEHSYVGERDLVQVGISSARGLAPSLHLNLGDDYLRQGRSIDARAQLVAAQRHLDALPQEGYGALIRRGIAGLESRLLDIDSVSKNPTTS